MNQVLKQLGHFLAGGLALSFAAFLLSSCLVPYDSEPGSIYVGPDLTPIPTPTPAPTPVPDCLPGAVVASQTSGTIPISLVSNNADDVIAQSFTINCTSGTLSTVTLKLVCSDPGTTSAMIKLYNTDDPDNFDITAISLKDVAVAGISTTPGNYIVDFTAGGPPTLNYGSTYWIFIDATGGTKGLGVYNSATTDNYTAGQLQEKTSGSWVFNSNYSDIYFTVTLQ